MLTQTVTFIVANSLSVRFEANCHQWWYKMDSSKHKSSIYDLRVAQWCNR